MYRYCKEHTANTEYLVTYKIYFICISLQRFAGVWITVHVNLSQQLEGKRDGNDSGGHEQRHSKWVVVDRVRQDQHDYYFPIVVWFVGFNHNLRQPIPKRQICQDAVRQEVDVGHDHGVPRSPFPEYNPQYGVSKVDKRKNNPDRRVISLCARKYFNYEIQRCQNKNRVAVLVKFGHAHHVVVVLDLFVFYSQRQWVKQKVSLFF